MISCYQIMTNAVNMFHNRDAYIYFYGAKGQVLTDEIMLALIAAEPSYYSKFSEEDIRYFMDMSRGKIGIDCSGYINLCTGLVNYSTGYINSSRNQTEPTAGTWGNCLYTTFGGTGRHIGLDIGGGRFLHIGSMGNSIELGIISEFPWERSGQIDGVDYFLTSNK